MEVNAINSSPLQPISAGPAKPVDENYAKRSGYMWECIGEENGCCLYRLKAEYAHLPEEELRKISMQGYPAIEPHKLAIEGISEQHALDFICYDKLKRLGYKFEMREGHMHMQVPKINTFNDLLDKLIAEDYGHLPVAERPSLKIFVSSGILSDLDYVKKLTIEGYDAVISDDVEFVHDHMFHLLPKIVMILKDYAEYKRVKGVITAQVSQTIEKIEAKSKEPLSAKEREYLELIKLALGVQIDTLATRYSPSMIEKEFSGHFKLEEILLTLWTHPTWTPYLNRRFASEKENVSPEYKLATIQEERYLLVDFYQKLISEEKRETLLQRTRKACKRMLHL